MKPEQVSSGLWVSCPACGHRNANAEPRCEKCGRRLALDLGKIVQEPSNPAIRAFPSLPNDRQRPAGSSAVNFTAAKSASRAMASSLPPHLRQQLSERVQEFRARRGNPTLPFAPAEQHLPEDKVVPIRVEPPRRETRGLRDGPRRSSIPANQQPDLEFPTPLVPSKELSIPPVASFRLRMIAACLDLALILAAALVFLLPLRLVAGPVTLDRFLLVGGLIASFVLALLYGGTFLVLAGATPAMRWLDLCVVNFDGRLASRQQRLWRLLGIIVSAGSFCLGYLWAAFDEEGLFWHDRISKTFLAATRDPALPPSQTNSAHSVLSRR